MLNLNIRPSLIGEMQALCSLINPKNKNLLSFSAIRSLFIDSPSLSWNLGRRTILSRLSVYSHRRSLRAGDRGSGNESRAFSSSSDPAENPSSWTTYDPVTDRLNPRLEAESAREASWYRGRKRNSQAETSEGDESPGESKVWTFYDPVEGTLVTRAMTGEDSREEKPRPAVDIPPRIKQSVQNKAFGRSHPSGDGSHEEGANSKASVVASSFTKKRTGKVKVSWVCENCGGKYGQWWGTCPSCEEVGSVKKLTKSEVCRTRGISEAALGSWLPQQSRVSVPRSLADVNMGRNQSEWRIPLSGNFGMEVSRVLGGGIVPGSLILIGGDPGVGKSTLLLQIADNVAQGFYDKGPAPVVYVSGEESIEQIADRADRMRISAEDLYLYSSTDIEDILNKIQKLSPLALIMDSIQTVYLSEVNGSAGNPAQLKECTSALLRFAKETQIPVLLIGHVTKTGDIAGPRMLEHIVDVVLYMEGERCSSYRLLRSAKNRFGSADELGVFEMSQSGLQAVLNPSEIFLSEHSSDSEVLAGLAVAVIIDGSRAFLIEVQALCVADSSDARHVNGIQSSKADMIISVLIKQAGLKLQGNAIFLNVVSGVKLTETAGDLALAAAISSSFLEVPIPNDVAFIGEIGLGGELRSVSRMDKRVISVAKLGYRKCIIPKSAEKLITALDLDITIVGCRNLKEVINTVFTAER